MINSTLQTTRIYWRDMLHMEQLPDDVLAYEDKKKTDIGWFNKNGLARFRKVKGE